MVREGTFNLRHADDLRIVLPGGNLLPDQRPLLVTIFGIVAVKGGGGFLLLLFLFCSYHGLLSILNQFAVGLYPERGFL